MKTARRTETMLALRARRTAYRIATDIQHPHLDAPPPPEPVIPIDDRPTLRRKYGRPTQRVLLLIAIVLWLKAASLSYLALWLHRKSW